MQRKPFFDAVRQLLHRGLRSDEVAQLDQAFDCANLDESAYLPAGAHAVGPEGIALLKHFEGCSRKRGDGMVEADPGSGGDPWTIGWGATGPGIGKGTIWTQAQCDERLVADLQRYGAEVAYALGDSSTTQLQFDALVSFHYNTGAIAKATLTRKHVAGDHAGAAREFDRWCYAGGRLMKGLMRRREAESALYRRG